MTSEPINNQSEDVLLTQYSRGAGCGCKISPQVLSGIIHTEANGEWPQILVGNSSNDDAAVYDLQDGNALISTTDFFSPIVDDAFDFGRVAAANALSDVYAMGGRPAMALAVLGWPVDKLPASLAKKVMEGARAVCSEAHVALCGGHSIDAAEPFFGLSVNGFVPLGHLKKNNTASVGDLLYLTKPIGTGILSTAMKRKKLGAENYGSFISALTSLNSIGELLGKIEGVHAMTDVTGFGLAGHLIEMAGENLSAVLNYDLVPLHKQVKELLAQRIVPDATYRNWNSYQHKIGFEKEVNVMEAFSTLPDPQTNGGLLVAVKPSAAAEVETLFGQHGLHDFAKPIGEFIPRTDKVILVK